MSSTDALSHLGVSFGGFLSPGIAELPSNLCMERSSLPNLRALQDPAPDARPKSVRKGLQQSAIGLGCNLGCERNIEK
jgi:hypothetical protein